MDIENKYGALEYQQKVLSMMIDVHAFLVEKGISYSLSDGSLLGAVRENGFIPWDDDMDIMMDRSNFEKFLSVCHDFKDYVVFRKLWIYRIQRTEDYNGSLTGTTIDVFVIDKVPLSRIKQRIKLFILKILQGMMKKHRNWNRFTIEKRMLVAVTYVLGRLFSDKRKFMWYDRISQIGKKDNALFVSCYNNSFSSMSKEYGIGLLDNISSHRFEDTGFFITQEYDSYLTTTYGDYMTPPPEEERKPAHMAFIKNSQ